MCLAIPGQVLEVVDESNRLAKVDVAGVRRNVNIGLLDEDGSGVGPGDWVLIHVGFAISKVDEEEAHGDPRAARGHGRGLRAGARGAEGERDRVTRRCDHAATATAITCGDDGVPMRVVRGRRRPRAGAVRGRGRSSARRSRSRSSRRSRRATTLLVHAGTALRAAGGGGVKFVDEFRDAELGQRAGRRDPRHRRAGPPLQGDGGVRRAHPLDLQVRDRRPAAGERRAGPRPGCPVCVIPMGRVDDGIAHRARAEGVIFTCFGDMMRVPGSERHAAGREGARAPTCAWSTRRSTRCGSPSRTPTARSCSSRSGSRRRRPRPR